MLHLLVNIFFSFALFFLFREYGVFLNTTITVIKVFWQENGNTGLLVKNTKSLWKSRGADKCSRFIIKKEEMKIFHGNFAALPSSSLKSKCACSVFTLVFLTKKSLLLTNFSQNIDQKLFLLWREFSFAYGLSVRGAYVIKFWQKRKSSF